MMTIKLNLALVVGIAFPFIGFAQYSPPDESALEGVIVETYYVSDDQDATDEDGGSLDFCSITYRVYVDMKPGYRLQAVYGNANNLLRISTSTEFFNNEDRGEISGDAIGDNFLGDNTVALDSWIAMGGASESHWGVLKTQDLDGSIVAGSNNDGGSESVDGGLLINNNPSAGLPLVQADGLLEGVIPEVTVVGLDLGVFGDENAGPSFESNGGAWSVLEGVQGPTEDNIVLIGQFTTTGTFSFQLNIQLGIPADLQCSHPDCHNTIQYVAVLNPNDATPGVQNDNKFEYADLNFSSEEIDCDATVSVQEVSIQPEVSVFPNPASTHTNLSLSNIPYGQHTLDLVNIQGMICRSEALVVSSENQNTIIDVSDLAKGLYTVVLKGQNGIYSSKFIVD